MKWSYLTMKYICAIPLSRSALKYQKGNMLMMSVFAIVVLAFLGGSMSRLLATGSDALVYEVYGLRALNAARSGLDEKVLQVFATQESDPNQCYSDAGTIDGSLSVERVFSVDGLQNCRVTALCTVSEIDSTSYYRFESQGLCELETDNIVVSRTLAIDGRDIQE